MTCGARCKPSLGRSHVIRVAATAALAIIVGASGIKAQQAPAPHQHSEVAAGVIEWFLPTAGFAYAGDWSRGFLPNAVRISAWAGLLSTSSNPDDTCEGSCQIWATAVIATTVWSVVGAVRTASDHNRSVSESRLLIGPSPEGGLVAAVRLPAL